MCTPCSELPRFEMTKCISIAIRNLEQLYIKLKKKWNIIIIEGRREGLEEIFMEFELKQITSNIPPPDENSLYAPVYNEVSLAPL